jgi:hypothetical protein
MPFAKLASIKQVASGGAAITGLAALESEALVVAVTTDPVKLVLCGGGAPRVVSVALDEAAEVALLTKMVAVVRSGDALWALLDIAHKPRIDQVGRDIKSLHARPLGEGAFAVGWDGQGAALRLEGREVGGRQFPLRGTVRACAIDGASTYVVVEGSGGGRFRDHPGATPESPDQTRVDLPVAAGGFDRVAPGRELAAVYRRGERQICIVRRRGAAALEAKMLELGESVADAAVIATSLFTAGDDGRLRLYDADTLERTSDGGVAQPTHELALGATGEPAALLATTRGGNKLWIGTSAGELWSCDAVRRG